MEENLKRAYEIVEESMGDIHLDNLKLKNLPSNLPKILNGSLYCNNNLLRDLKYAPEIINGNFCCSGNLLTSLKHCAKIVDRNLFCNYNFLISLKGSPKVVNGHFFCYNHHNLKKIDFSGLTPFIKGKFHDSLAFCNASSQPACEEMGKYQKNALQKEKTLWKSPQYKSFQIKTMNSSK